MEIGCECNYRCILNLVEMATNWTDAGVLKLIELWKKQGIQEELEGSMRNKHVYVKLASQLAEEGVEKTGERCICKVKKLCQEYLI